MVEENGNLSNGSEASDRDLREVVEEEPQPSREDDVRVPSADETAAAIERANRALVEMKARDEMDAEEQAEHRTE